MNRIYYQARQVIEEHVNWLSNRANNLTRKFVGDFKTVATHSDKKYSIAYDPTNNKFVVVLSHDTCTNPLIVYSNDKRVLQKALNFFRNLYTDLAYYRDIHARICDDPQSISVGELNDILNGIKAQRREYEEE